MNATQQQAVVDFYRYPPIGDNDWLYGFATAKVRVLASMMLSRGALLDMANAESFAAAIELLAGGEYAIAPDAGGVAGIEKMLLEKRTQVRELFADLMLDDEIQELLRARVDFANMRL
ncbi:MAG: V-type ATPase subunit, partial [Planctomycetes bacterium]|nr:V-type ATPase subunit [Planctomycetota bacterium]